MKYYAGAKYPLLDIEHLPLNRIESEVLFRWECMMESNGKDEWWDEEQDAVHHEVNFFIDCVLPDKPTEGWAMWSDRVEIMVNSEELAVRISRVMDIFADGHYSYYSPAEDERNGETDERTGWWCVYWD